MKIKSGVVITMCLLCGTPGFAGVELDQEASSVEFEAVHKDSRLADITKRFLESARGGPIDPRLSASFASRIWSEVQLEEIKAQLHSTPQSRHISAMRILGSDVYKQMETHYLQVLMSSSNRVDTLVALNMLGRTLSSANSEVFITEKYKEGLRLLMDEDPINDPRPDVLFAFSEALCYLGDSSGIAVLTSALGSENASTQMKCSAIKALAFISTADAHDVLRRFAPDLLGSDDSEIAYCALDTLSSVNGFDEHILVAAQTQLDRLSQLTQKQELDRDDLGLLMKVSLILRHAIEADELSAERKDKAKNAVRCVLLAGKRNEQERIVSLFSRLAGDEDIDIIKRLLQSESPKSRTEGVRSVLHLDTVVQKRFLSALVSLLDDNDRNTRDLALYVIRQIKGEKSTNLLSDGEFKKESARIKSWWIETENGIE